MYLQTLPPVPTIAAQTGKPSFPAISQVRCMQLYCAYGSSYAILSPGQFALSFTTDSCETLQANVLGTRSS